MSSRFFFAWCQEYIINKYDWHLTGVLSFCVMAFHNALYFWSPIIFLINKYTSLWKSHRKQYLLTSIYCSHFFHHEILLSNILQTILRSLSANNELFWSFVAKSIFWLIMGSIRYQMLLAVNRGFAFISCSTNQSHALKTIVSAMGESYIRPCIRSN